MFSFIVTGEALHISLAFWDALNKADLPEIPKDFEGVMALFVF